VVGDSATLLHTTDGGNQWNPVPTSLIGNYVSIDFSHPDTGMILSDFRFGLLTHDGGATWFQVEPGNGLCYWDQVEAAGNGLFYLSYDGCFGTQAIFTYDPFVQDTTAYMDLLTDFPQFQFGDSIDDIARVSPGVAVAMGDGGLILRTTDSGESWNVVTPPDTSSDFEAVAFQNDTFGVALDQDLFLPQFYSFDGGQSWVVDSAWGATFFYPEWGDLACIDGACLLGGLTNTGGATASGITILNEYSPATEVFLNQVIRATELVSDSSGWVVGEDGLIARLSPFLATGVSDPGPSIEFSVHPNPARSRAELRVAASLEATRGELLDLQGRVLRTFSWSGSHYVLGLDGLAAGTYLLRIEHSLGRAAQRIVIE